MSGKRTIAVIGGGYWGKNLVRNFAGLGGLHTICDSNPETLEQLAREYPDINTERDYQKTLDHAGIKGVVIATPAVLHYAMAKQALLAGKDVFVEKPLALTVAEGMELVALAEEKGRILLVGHVLEYHPALLRLKGLVDKGELGKLQYIYSNRLNLGKFRSEENILWSFAPHDISAVLLLLGGEMPVRVSAHGGYYLHREIADTTLTMMGFKDGVNAHIFVSWLHPFKEQKLVVVGDKAMAMFDDTSPQDKLFLYRHRIERVENKLVPHPREAEAVKVPVEEPLKLECQDFLRCVETRQRPRVDGYKGLQVLRVLSYCQQSLKEGGRVIAMDKEERNFFIHETSVLEEPSEIGEGTKVWHFSHLMPGVIVGRGCVIGQNVFIGNGVKIGDNVKLENNVSVYEGVTLEDGVFCGPSCVFTNVINPRSHISRKHEFRPSLVKRGATIGANATIVCGHTIGRYAFVGAGAVVTRDIPDYALVYGNPAVLQGWMCECGNKLEFGKGLKSQCPACGKVYRREGKERIAIQ